MRHIGPAGALWRRALVAATIVGFLVSQAVGDAQCYGVNGQKSTAAPCNSAATGQAGSHSSCCDQSKQEACLATGLCYSTQRNDNNTFWAEGCTDPTGADPSCPQYCGTTSQFVSTPLQTSYTMLFCGAQTWCCCFDSFGKTCDRTACCAKNFTLARGLGGVIRQFTNGGPDAAINGTGAAASTLTASNDPNCVHGQKLITAIVAGVLGSVLLATLVAFGFSFSRSRSLRRQVDNLLLQLSAQKRSGSLTLNTGVVPPNMTPRASNVKDADLVVSPVSYENAVVTRASSTSFHGQNPFPPPLQVQPQQQQMQQPPPPPQQQQQLVNANYSFNQPPRTPTWTRQGSFSHSIDGTIGAAVTTHPTGTLNSELGRSQVSELPGNEKYMG